VLHHRPVRIVQQPLDVCPRTRCDAMTQGTNQSGASLGHTCKVLLVEVPCQMLPVLAAAPMEMRGMSGEPDQVNASVTFGMGGEGYLTLLTFRRRP
jgi:hypothetical protein